MKMNNNFYIKKFLLNIIRKCLKNVNFIVKNIFIK